jgi:hypothetical protein
MTTLTAVSAVPPWPNPGMASVDLALPALLRRHGISADLRFLWLYTPAELRAQGSTPYQERLERRQALPFEYGRLRDRSHFPGESDAIVYWGDFLHAYDYLNQMAKALVDIGAAPDMAAGAREVYRCLFLTEAPEEALDRTVAFGGTLVFNRERDYQNPDYGPRLERFVRGARGVWMRDVYSALRVSTLRGGPAFALGVDCSLLLRDEDVASLPQTSWSPGGEAEGTAGIFFGRTASDTRRLARFARDLCRELGCEAEWLPWFDPSYEPNHLPAAKAAFPKLRASEDPEPPSVGDLLRRLSRYRFVLSDTYHVCLNAWRAGVPALCFGEASPSLHTYDVSTGWCCAWRDKRHVFYSMHDAMEFYLFREELADRTAYANRLLYTVHLLQEQDVAQAIVQNIHARRDAAERELVGTLRELVAAPRTAEVPA